MIPRAEWVALFVPAGMRTKRLTNPPYVLQTPLFELNVYHLGRNFSNVNNFAGMKLEENQVQVLWSQKEMEVEKIKDDWTLVERTLMRGDIVVLGDDTNGQMGTVTEVHSFVELEHVYGNDKPIYRGVPAVMLYPSSEWRFELAVARNGWIGSVSRFCWRLRIKLETSETIVTVDTWSMGEAPITLLRRSSHFLKDQPAEGRFLVGTTVAISTSSHLENVEGDANWIVPASARTEFPDAMSSIHEPDRNLYALGLIVSSELSGVIVSWADHAQGGAVGNTRPHCHQSVHDISVVDPYFCNSIGRYELSWATPQIRQNYVDRDYFYFPDGSRIPCSLIADHHDKSAAKTLKSLQEAASKAENGKDSTGSSETAPGSSQSESQSSEATDSNPGSSSEAPTQDTSFPPVFNPSLSSTAKKPILSFQHLAEPSAFPSKFVKISDTSITTRFTNHPSKTDSTTTGTYERVMTDYEYSRRLAPLMSPHAIEKGGLGYVEDDLVYVRSVTCFVDVQWQDGRTTRKHLSTELLPYLILGDTDFQPNDYIQSVPTTVEETEKSRLAVTQSVDHVNRVATVWWVEEDSIEPHVSIYMLEDADDKYHYRLGYFVLRVLLSHETRFEGTVGLVDNMDDRGRVYVLWIEGTSGWYYPCQLMPFDMADYDLTPPDDVTSPSENLVRGDRTQDDEIIYLTRPYILHPEHEDENEWESESLAGENTDVSREVLYSYNNEEEAEESSIVDEYGAYLDTDSDSDNEEEEEEQDSDDEESGEDGDSNENGSTTDDSETQADGDARFDIGESSELYSDLNGKGEMSEEQLIAMSIAESLKTFRDEQKKTVDPSHDTDKTSDEETEEADEEVSPLAPFRFSDAVPTNHQYRTFSSPTSSALPKLALKEWNLLQTATLDGAYVIAYEDRVDLFRFLILGAHGTPFYLSWFMFDVRLDSNHPAHPPRVHFHSLGPKLHPNLYEDGNVCLSLLGTWNGEGVEMWDPDVSNILQVVLSIQGLILGVKEPYYLEAGYDRHRGTPEGTANSLVYNERSFLLSVQQMKKLIERPPPEFRELILDSFRKNRHIILELENALSQDPEVLAKVDMTMFGLPKGPPSLGFVSAFKSIFPSVKKVLESI